VPPFWGRLDTCPLLMLEFFNFRILRQAKGKPFISLPLTEKIIKFPIAR